MVRGAVNLGFVTSVTAVIVLSACATSSGVNVAYPPDAGVPIEVLDSARHGLKEVTVVSSSPPLGSVPDSELTEAFIAYFDQEILNTATAELVGVSEVPSVTLPPESNVAVVAASAAPPPWCVQESIVDRTCGWVYWEAYTSGVSQGRGVAVFVDVGTTSGVREWQQMYFSWCEVLDSFRLCSPDTSTEGPTG